MIVNFGNTRLSCATVVAQITHGIIKMTDITAILRNIRRPGLLIRAARCGQLDYDRTRDLKRVLKKFRISSGRNVIDGLMDVEKHLEETRVSGDAGYSVSRHVEVLIALMAEASLLPKPRPKAI